MPSTLSRARSGFRHRIQEITLHPTSSKYSIELELMIDNIPLYSLPAVVPGSPLSWNLASHFYDVQSESKIKLKIIEKHSPSWRNRIGYLEYLVSDAVDKPSVHLEASDPTSQSVGFGSTTKQWDHGGPFVVNFTFPDLNKTEDAYLVALDKANAMMDSKTGPLEGLGRFRQTFKTLVDVGKVVAELNSSAMMVVEVCAMAWEYLEKLQQLHDDLRKLLVGLERMIPFIEFVKEHARNTLLGDTITALLNLIEDASNFMLGYFADKAPIRLLRSPFDGSAPDRVGDLLQQFTDLKEDFDRSVRVQVLASVLTNTQHALIDRLNPAAQSHYDYTPPCQIGTRRPVLDDINQWIDDRNTTEKLLWLCGHAGQGKSSIASSICSALDKKGTLGAHFFCKRDDPNLRNPERILNTIVHRLATNYKAYGHAVSGAIDGNTELPNSSLQNRYSGLIEKLLQALPLNTKKQSDVFVVVVDALDECDKGDGRRSLLAYMRGLSTLLPWIKVIVTSRPDQDIKDAFEKPNDPVVCVRNIHDYNASDDIYAYIRKQMTDIATRRKRTDWPDDTVQLLSQRADGLFIWAATACRFISDAVNVDQRFKQVLEGTESSGSSYRLDVLYTAAIRQSMDSEDQDNIEYTRQCIAAVVATASRTPLSVSALESLLCDKFGAGTLRYVVDHLGSVLYEDKKNGNAVRVYHPSFADYLTNPARSKEMYVATDSINTTLAECCLSTMLRELRFNICGLETSHLLNRDIPDLGDRVRVAIRAHLEYSCVHWSSHLALAPANVLNPQLGEFLLGPVLLFWIESLSLLSRLSVALLSLKEARDKISGTEGSYAACAHDAYRFVLAFYDAISEGTPHLYISALPLAPNRSMIAKRMWPLFPNIFRAAGDSDEHWSPCLRTISLSQTLFAIAVSPDGRLVATNCPKGVQLWDVTAGEAASSPLECSLGRLAFSDDGRLLFCRQTSGGIQVWDIKTLEPVLMALPAMSVRSSVIALSCNDRLAVLGDTNHTITVWDLGTSTTIFELAGHSDKVESIMFSPNGRLIASTSRNRKMHIWDAHTGATLFNQSNVAHCVAFSPDSRYVVSGLWNRVQIWDTSTYMQTMELHVSDISSVAHVAYAPNGGSIVVSFGNSIGVWDLEDASPSPTHFIGHTDTVNAAMFSPDGCRVISGSADGTVRIWDIHIHIATLPLRAGHSAWVNEVVFSPDGLHVMSASSDATVGTWDSSTGRPIRDLISSPIESPCLSISPDCRHAVFRHKATLHMWDIGSATSTALNSVEGVVLAYSFSSDSLRFAFTGVENNTLQVHDVVTGAELLAPIATGQHYIQSVAHSPCGRFIASGDGDGISDCTVCVWGAKTGEAVGSPLEGGDITVESLAFSPDGCLIAAGSHYSIRVYEVGTGTSVHEILALDSLTAALAFSSDGRRIVSGSSNGTIRIWDLELDILTPVLLFGHTGAVMSVTFSRDGSLIASGSSDCTIRIWDAANTTTIIDAALSRLTSAIYPVSTSWLDSARGISQAGTNHSELPNMTLSTFHLAHRLTRGGWVSLTEGNVLMWLLPDHRVIDDSIVQISAKHLPHHSIDFSKFVHGDRWISVASDPIRCHNLNA